LADIDDSLTGKVLSCDLAHVPSRLLCFRMALP
jgi:hypothetical protein